MTTEPLDAAAIMGRYERACEEITRLAVDGPVNGWRWSIPANPERDTDLILTASVVDVPLLLAALATAEAKLTAGEASDGYHTHNELYEYRLLYNAAAFNAWAAAETYPVVKSWRHSDGEECFGGGWFVVVASLPDGIISNHYEANDWGLFQVPEGVPPEYDGHTPADVAFRIRLALAGDPQ